MNRSFLPIGLFAFCAFVTNEAFPQESRNTDSSRVEKSPKFWSTMVARDARSDAHEVEKLSLQAANSADVAEYIDLAEASLHVLESSLPAAKSHYEALLRGEEGLLHSDEGRFLAQNGEFVETMFRWLSQSRLPVAGQSDSEESDREGFYFGPRERAKRIELLQNAIAELSKNTGETFDPEETPSALVVVSNSGWSANAFQSVDSRIALLESYIESVPENIDTSALPTPRGRSKSTVCFTNCDLGGTLE